MAKALSDYPVFNHPQLLVNLGGDLELAAELTHLYCVEGRDLLAKLEAALRAENVEASMRMAHSIKGASANVAADQMFYHANSIEAKAEQNNWEAIRQEWYDLVSAFEAYSTHIHRIFVADMPFSSVAKES